AASPPERHPLSLHDALPICGERTGRPAPTGGTGRPAKSAAPSGQRGRTTSPAGKDEGRKRSDTKPQKGRAKGKGNFNKGPHGRRDRKSTRLNSSHVKISYAV